MTFSFAYGNAEDSLPHHTTGVRLLKKNVGPSAEGYLIAR